MVRLLPAPSPGSAGWDAEAAGEEVPADEAGGEEDEGDDGLLESGCCC